MSKLGKATEIHQLWLDGAFTIFRSHYEEHHSVELPACVIVYGYPRRGVKDVSHVGVTIPPKKAMPIITLHPHLWGDPIVVLVHLLVGITEVYRRLKKKELAGCQHDVVTYAASMLPPMPANKIEAPPSKKGRMLLWQCECTKVRSGRKDLELSCGICGEPLVLASGVAK